MTNWHIVKEDGNPKMKGLYIVILLFGDNHESATLSQRYFGDARCFEDVLMEDQQKEGLAWTSYPGRYDHEIVYAWRIVCSEDFPRLPDGVIPKY